MHQPPPVGAPLDHEPSIETARTGVNPRKLKIVEARDLEPPNIQLIVRRMNDAHLLRWALAIMQSSL
jgi:hypothetical protein